MHSQNERPQNGDVNVIRSVLVPNAIVVGTKLIQLLYCGVFVAEASILFLLSFGVTEP